jgi:hypothetical protein
MAVMGVVGSVGMSVGMSAMGGHCRLCMGVMGVVGSVGMSAVGGHCRAVNGSDGCSGECGHECYALHPQHSCLCTITLPLGVELLE